MQTFQNQTDAKHIILSLVKSQTKLQSMVNSEGCFSEEEEELYKKRGFVICPYNAFCWQCLKEGSLSMWTMFSSSPWSSTMVVPGQHLFRFTTSAHSSSCLPFSWSRIFCGIAGRLTPACNNCGRPGGDRCLIGTIDQTLDLSRLTSVWPPRPGRALNASDLLIGSGIQTKHNLCWFSISLNVRIWLICKFGQFRHIGYVWLMRAYKHIIVKHKF